MALRSRTQRGLLYGFIASISGCALIGIFFIIADTFDEKLLLTLLAVGGTSILALGSTISWERRSWHPVGLCGMVAAAATLAVSLFAIWIPEHFHGDAERLIGILWVLAVALPHIGLVSMARLKRKWIVLKLGTAGISALLASLICFLILFEPWGDLWGRVVGVLAILFTLGTISIPILHRLSVLDKRVSVRTVELKLVVVCPRCGKQHELSVGRSTCPTCSLGFNIEIEENNCAKCGYPLYQLTSNTCPECGSPVSRSAGPPSANAGASPGPTLV